jgi:hypothetical protein
MVLETRVLNRHLGRALYVVGAALILIPMFDAGTSVLPLRFAEARWRYGSVGLLSNSLLIPLGGAALVFAVAHVQGHRLTQRVLGILAAISAVLCVLATLSFALDAMQSQGEIKPELHTAFIVGSTTAAMKLLVGALAFGFFALSALKRSPSEAAKGAKHEKVLIGGLPKPPRKSGVPT